MRGELLELREIVSTRGTSLGWLRFKVKNRVHVILLIHNVRIEYYRSPRSTRGG